MREQRPHDAGILVGQRHRRYVLVLRRCSTIEPATLRAALALVLVFFWA